MKQRSVILFSFKNFYHAFLHTQEETSKTSNSYNIVIVLSKGPHLSPKSEIVCSEIKSKINVREEEVTVKLITVLFWISSRDRTYHYFTVFYLKTIRFCQGFVHMIYLNSYWYLTLIDNTKVILSPSLVTVKYQKIEFLGEHSNTGFK